MDRGKTWIRWLVLYFIALGVSFWSYGLVDKNLVLFPFDWSLQWQRWFWSWGDNRSLYATVFGLLTLGWWAGWGWLGRQTWRQRTWREWFKWLLPLYLIVLAGHNALSHDIFNYLFNAKMVLVYGANPHVQVALDFATDPWVRFMHNIHTPAPYGYGWTIISLVPLLASGLKFLVSYALMKGWMLLGLLWYLGVAWWGLRQFEFKERGQRFAWLALHPVVVIETLLNGHNDVWMMAPALLALLLAQAKPSRRWHWLAILLLFGFSISLKLASVVLLPLLIGLLGVQLGESWLRRWSRLHKLGLWLAQHWASWGALLMLVPLFTARSQWFHPWYLIWPLTFLPFIHWRWLRWSLIGLSVGSLWRYVPWMLADLQYSPAILLQMRLVTWSGGALGLLGGVLMRLIRPSAPKTNPNYRATASKK